MWLKYSCVRTKENIIDRLIDWLFQEEEEQGLNCVLCTNMEEERQVALETLAQKSQQVQDLQKDRADLEEMLTQRCDLLIWLLIRKLKKKLALRINSSSSFCCSNNRCAELSKELANQKEEFCQQVTCVRKELKSEVGALQRRLEELEQERDGKEMLHDFNLEKCMLSHCFCVCQRCYSWCQKRTNG